MSTLRCPQCGGELSPDNNNPGKMLCYACRKRMDEDKVRQYWGQFAQQKKQPQHARQEQTWKPQHARVQESQPQQPAPQPQTFGQSSAQPFASQQPVVSQPQAFDQQPQFGHPEYGGTPTPQPAPEPQQIPNGFGQGGQQAAAAAAAAFANPSAYNAPAAFDAIPSTHADRPVTFSLRKFNFGQFFPSFKNLFTSPQQAKIDAAQSSGIAMGWFSALVKILLYIGALCYLIGGIYSIFQPFLPSLDAYVYKLNIGLTVMTIVNGVVYVLFGLATLFVRKEMGDFIRGAGMKFIALLVLTAAWGLLYTIVTTALLSRSFFAFFGISFIVSLVIDVLLISVNWIYFKKRGCLFTAEYPETQPATPLRQPVQQGYSQQPFAGQQGDFVQQQIPQQFGQNDFRQGTQSVQQGYPQQAPSQQPFSGQQGDFRQYPNDPNQRTTFR